MATPQGTGLVSFEQTIATILDCGCSKLGPMDWRPEAQVDRLRLPYWVMLSEQTFVMTHKHVSQIELEASGMRGQAIPSARLQRARP